MKKQNYYQAKLCGVSFRGDMFEFKIFHRDTNRILGIVTVQLGKVVEYNDYVPCEKDDWTSEEVRCKANRLAKEKNLFAVAEGYFFAYAMQSLHSFEALNQLVPNREALSRIEEETYVAKCYELYREEGFAKTFQTPYTWNQEHNGQPFKVLGEISVRDKNWDLEQLPQWRIQFPDGTTSPASPEEIILSEQRC